MFHILDEHALVTALKDIGVVFFRRTPDSVVISFVSTIAVMCSLQ